MLRGRGRWLVPFAAGVLFTREPAALSVEPFSLAWDAPAPCPDGASVRSVIQRWLDQPDMRLDPRSVHVQATVRPHPAGWELDVTLRSTGGAEHQTLVAERCETLVDVVALKVALAADPSALMRSVERSMASVPPRPAPALKLGVRGHLGAGVGPLPEPSGFAALHGSAEFPGWRVEVGASGWLPVAATYPELPNVGAHFALVTVDARACALASMPSFDFPVCAGAEVGVMQGTGFGVARTETSDRLWAAVTLGPALRLPLSSAFSLWIGTDAVIALSRPSFQVRGLEVLYRPDATAARVWTGVELGL
jgi:hypothetical protein